MARPNLSAKQRAVIESELEFLAGELTEAMDEGGGRSAMVRAFRDNKTGQLMVAYNFYAESQPNTALVEKRKLWGKE